MSSRRDVASIAFAAGLKLRGFVPRPTRTRREEEEVRSQGPKEDAAARQLARLPLDQRAQVRAGDLVVAALLVLNGDSGELLNAVDSQGRRPHDLLAGDAAEALAELLRPR